jgi:hypothetical protein
MVGGGVRKNLFMIPLELIKTNYKYIVELSATNNYHNDESLFAVCGLVSSCRRRALNLINNSITYKTRFHVCNTRKACLKKNRNNNTFKLVNGL